MGSPRYAMFEGYLSAIIRARLRQHPRLMSGQRELKYEQVFLTESKETLIESMIEREMRELMYLSLPDLCESCEIKWDSSLSPTNRMNSELLVAIKNCLLHNRAIVDVKLAGCRPTLLKGERLSVSEEDVTSAVNVLRKFAYQIDQVFEAEDRTGDGS